MPICAVVGGQHGNLILDQHTDEVAPSGIAAHRDGRGDGFITQRSRPMDVQGSRHLGERQRTRLSIVAKGGSGVFRRLIRRVFYGISGTCRVPRRNCERRNAMAQCLLGGYTRYVVEPDGLGLLFQRCEGSPGVGITYSFLTLVEIVGPALGAPSCRQSARTRMSAPTQRLAWVSGSSGSDRRVSVSCSQYTI